METLEPTRIILLRHGVTKWNAQKRFQGWAATRLNDEGRVQAKLAGEYLSSKYSFDLIVSSDCIRARETAEIVHQQLLEPVNIMLDREFREINVGLIQGLTRDEINDVSTFFPELKKGLVNKEYFHPPEGEHVREFRKRVVSRFQEIIHDYSGTILIVTHGGVIKELIGWIKQIPPGRAFDVVKVDNASIWELEYYLEAGNYEIIQENFVGFIEKGNDFRE